MATLLPLEEAAPATCLRRCDFPDPAIPETSMDRLAAGVEVLFLLLLA